ncbi:trans-aconitate methyltransferase [Rugosimonospora acidiphila]|uniref:Trans-aconitate methyltransferase n=1 Tax=Rugosimonospora acidiphila TaxID=556531 RepID=A0ABP9S4V9_9ACTN
MPRVSPDWLGLREVADAAARAPELIDLVRGHLYAEDRAGPHQRDGSGRRLLLHDFGTGTGSMGRWLAPQLPGPQHWIMYDRDPDLLRHVGAMGTALDGTPVTAETRRHDITRLSAADLRDKDAFPGRGSSDEPARLVTASALLDLLTADEVERVAQACVGARVPALLTLSVTGRVDLLPHHPLDARVGEAFNAHQRRTVGGRRLLGPDAVEVAATAFARRGSLVHVRDSPWRLGADQAELASEWFTGWLAAACEESPELTRVAGEYGRRRLAEAAEGRLGVVVHHSDLFVQHE